MTFMIVYPMTLLALFNGRVRIKEPKVRAATVEVSVESHIHFDDEISMSSKFPVH
ncbi:hypothetical protein BD779DRAFT_1494732, partial [Infundibulicybe gibba]